MKYPTLIILTLALALFVSDVVWAVEITLFYQLNENAYQFIKNELYPTVLFVNQYIPHQRPDITVLLKPYTTLPCQSYTNDDRLGVFLCAEAKIHACATSTQPAILPSDRNRLRFVHCSIQRQYADSDGFILNSGSRNCRFNPCFDSTLLAFCVNSVDGDALLSKNAEDLRGLRLNETSAPLLLFDQVVVEDQEKALNNLMAALCEKSLAPCDRCCGMPRVKAERQFDFTGEYAFPLNTKGCF